MDHSAAPSHCIQQGALSHEGSSCGHPHDAAIHYPRQTHGQELERAYLSSIVPAHPTGTRPSDELARSSILLALSTARRGLLLAALQLGHDLVEQLEEIILFLRGKG